MGVAPLLFLAEKLAKRKTLVLIGAETKKAILAQKEFASLGCDVKISTNDGSAGFKGNTHPSDHASPLHVDCGHSTGDHALDLTSFRSAFPAREYRPSPPHTQEI